METARKHEPAACQSATGVSVRCQSGIVHNSFRLCARTGTDEANTIDFMRQRTRQDPGEFRFKVQAVLHQFDACFRQNRDGFRGQCHRTECRVAFVHCRIFGAPGGNRIGQHFCNHILVACQRHDTRTSLRQHHFGTGEVDQFGACQRRNRETTGGVCA